MANTKSAAKRSRQGAVLRTRNSGVISALRSGQRKLRTLLVAGRLDEAKTQFSEVSAALDKAAKRGIIHKNSASRRKGVLNRSLKAS